MKTKNKKQKLNTSFCSIIACALIATGCQTATVDRSAAQAKAEAPEAAKVEVVSLPHEPSLPTFVVAILPFDDSASGVTSGGRGHRRRAVCRGHACRHLHGRA